MMCTLKWNETTVGHVFSLQARLYSLQADPATYCNEPDGKQHIGLQKCYADCTYVLH